MPGIACAACFYFVINVAMCLLVFAIPRSRIPAVFANPESRDWQRPIPGSRDYKNVKNVLFGVLNDTNNNSSSLMNKIFDVH